MQSVERFSGAASQPGLSIAQDPVIAEVMAPPGAFPLEGLQPSAAEAIGQGDEQPLLGRGEPGHQPSQLPKLGLINDHCVHGRSL
jgi:hypothetical protein